MTARIPAPRLSQFSQRLSRRQTGLTLVELMVALVLGLLIAAASVAALIIARTGFTSVDNSAQLRENARFATSLIQRITIQAGFENVAYGFFSESGGKPPGLRGFDDSLVNSSMTGDVSGVPATSTPLLAHGTRSTVCSVTDTSCVNGSDVLVVRFWGDSRVPGGAADGSMINCAGESVAEGTDRATSIFHVARSSSGEPTLACTYLSPTLGWQTRPLVTGVEAFQVLYGLDTLNAAGANGTDSVADHYRTAQQVDGALLPGVPTGVTSNWQLVRTVRIGLVIRGSVPNAVDRAATGQTIPVLGTGFTDTSTDPLSNLTVPADGRLRQNLVFTVHLRNEQFAP